VQTGVTVEVTREFRRALARFARACRRLRRVSAAAGVFVVVVLGAGPAAALPRLPLPLPPLPPPLPGLGAPAPGPRLPVPTLPPPVSRPRVTLPVPSPAFNAPALPAVPVRAAPLVLASLPAFPMPALPPGLLSGGSPSPAGAATPAPTPGGVTARYRSSVQGADSGGPCLAAASAGVGEPASCGGGVSVAGLAASRPTDGRLPVTGGLIEPIVLLGSLLLVTGIRVRVARRASSTHEPRAA
jgi:hypothetical protein